MRFMLHLLNQLSTARENQLRLNSDITLISATSQQVSVGFFYPACMKMPEMTSLAQEGPGRAMLLAGRALFPNAKLLICVRDYLTLNITPALVQTCICEHTSTHSHTQLHRES